MTRIAPHAVTLLFVVAGVAGAAAAGVGASAGMADGHVTFVHSGDAITVEAEPRQAIAGESTLPPGTELTVRVRSAGETEPRFVKSVPVRVAEDGTFTAYFDFSDQSEGDTFEATVRYDGSSEQVSGEVVASDGETPGPTATPVPTTERETRTPPSDTPDGYGFADPTPHVRRGGTAELVLAVPSGETATVRVGDESEFGYETAVTVRDGNDDGRVTVTFDTAAAGRNGTTTAVASDGDELVSRAGETELGSPLDAAPYHLNLYAGEGTDDDPASVGSLYVLERRATSGPESPSWTPGQDPTTDATATRTAVSSDAGRFGPALGAGALLVGVVLGGVGVLFIDRRLRQ